MALPFHTQLQPYEEHQSPSPTEERENPYELALHRSTSPKFAKRSNSSRSTHSPVDINTLQRQLSGDPDNPPPAWQRRPSISTTRTKSSTRSARSLSSGESPVIPPIPSASARRHPYLTMTATRTPGLPTQLFLHESPNGSSTSLNDDHGLTLPQPAFRRRQGNSSRSSMTSQDLSSLTSEELWALEQENSPMADMSNPLTRAAERPLDTVRRQSSRIEHSPYRNGLPQDVIWPAAPHDVDLYAPPSRTISVTSMASLRSPGKRMSRRQSRQASQTSIDVANIMNKAAMQKPNPTSPHDVLISSNNSSSTSLASHVMPSNKSTGTLSRPPSVYYSRDFLSTLAPREGGYAIAASMGNGLGAVGTMSVEDKRRSGVDHDRPRSMARAPMSKSSGMGRWSIDGGENYGKPYGTPSNNTTQTSLSMRAGSTSDTSPPLEEDGTRTSILPDGAQSPATRSELPPPVPTSVPVVPSPLSQNTAAADLPRTATSTAPPAPAPISLPDSAPSTLVDTPTPVATPKPPSPLNAKKSKKDLAKEAKASAKAAEKAAAAKAAADKAQAARDAALKKQADKDAAKKKKEDDKRKEKEAKEKRKAEKKAAKAQKNKPIARAVPAAAPKAAPQAIPQAAPVSVAPPVAAKPAALPRTQSERGVPASTREEPKPSASMPINKLTTTTSKSAAADTTPSARRTGIFGTLRKRMSIFGDLRTADGTSSPRESATTPRAVPTDFAPAKEGPIANSTSAGPPAHTDLQRVQTPPQRTVASMQTPEPLSHLPPRTSSHTPMSSHVAQMGSPTQSAMSTPTAGFANDTPQRAQSPLNRTKSNDLQSRDGSPSSNRRHSSLRGPRPMPRAAHSPTPERDMRSRSDSIRSADVSQTHVPSGFAFKDGTPAANVPASTSSESTEFNDSVYSQTNSKVSSGGDLASPFTSDGEVMADSTKVSVDLPERGGSSETVHPVAPVQVAATQAVVAH